jgi:hypothetical protein
MSKLEQKILDFIQASKQVDIIIDPSVSKQIDPSVITKVSILGTVKRVDYLRDKEYIMSLMKTRITKISFYSIITDIKFFHGELLSITTDYSEEHIKCIKAIIQLLPHHVLYKFPDRPVLEKFVDIISRSDSIKRIEFVCNIDGLAFSCNDNIRDFSYDDFECKNIAVSLMGKNVTKLRCCNNQLKGVQSTCVFDSSCLNSLAVVSRANTLSLVDGANSFTGFVNKFVSKVSSSTNEFFDGKGVKSFLNKNLLSLCLEGEYLIEEILTYIEHTTNLCDLRISYIRGKVDRFIIDENACNNLLSKIMNKYKGLMIFNHMFGADEWTKSEYQKLDHVYIRNNYNLLNYCGQDIRQNIILRKCIKKRVRNRFFK